MRTVIVLLVVAGAVAWWFWPPPPRARSERSGELPARVVDPAPRPPPVAAKQSEKRLRSGVIRGPVGEEVADAQVRIDDADPIRTRADRRFEFVWPEGTSVLFGFKGGEPAPEVTVQVKGTKEHQFDWTELSR